ncbi:MAG: cell division ATP-binding protein FtsE [Gemmatimonadota bacterium]
MIRFTSVAKLYETGGGPALERISFHVGRGEFVFLTGHSGAGKSTILKLIYAEERPSSGDVRALGFQIPRITADEIPRLRRRLGIVFQDFRLLTDRTAAENIAFALEVTGAREDVIPQRVNRVLEQVGLANKAEAFPRELSGGEQQRIAIARALVNDPAVLLADEPTGNLDERASRGVYQLLRDINDTGTVVLMATHNLELVRASGQRIVELRDGTLVFDSAADQEEVA